ncbi:MAG: hypothetical protein JWR57_106 [Mycetocola sp.]|nr:hypothetical protein [Mycetocola sp.]
MTTRNKASFPTPRKLPSGRYQVRFTDREGKAHTAGTFRLMKEAKAALAELQARVQSGGWRDPKLSSITFEAFAEQYFELRSHKLSLITVQNYRSLLKCHLLPTFGSMRMGDISSIDVDLWHTGMATAKTPVVTRNAYFLLSGIMTLAIRHKLIVSNPCEVEDAGKEAAEKRPTFTVEDFMAVREECPTYLHAPLMLMLCAHLRLGELCALDRIDLDLKTGMVSITKQLLMAPGGLRMVKPKAGSLRTIKALPQGLEAVKTYLAEQPPKMPHAPLFIGVKGGRLPRNTLQTEWAAARVRAGLPSIHLHDIRHIGLTFAAQMGATPKELMRRAGHSTMAASIRYQHAEDDRDSTIAEKAGQELERRLAHGRGSLSSLSS